MKNLVTYRDQYVERLKQMNVNKNFKFACQKAGMNIFQKIRKFFTKIFLLIQKEYQIMLD